MLDDFRRLPPVARIFVVLMSVSALLGIVLLLVLGTQNLNKPKPKASITPGTVVVPTPTSTVPSDQPPGTYVSTTPSPIPTAFPSATTPTPDHTNIANAGVPGKAVSLPEQTKAYLETRDGIMQWCTYSSKETKAAHVKRVQAYFVSGAEQAQASNYIDLIQDQQCVVNAGQAQFVLSKTHLRLVIHISTVTIYQGAAVVKGVQQSQFRNSDITYDAYKVGNKWLIGELTAS